MNYTSEKMMEPVESYKTSSLNFEVRISSVDPALLEEFKKDINKLLIEMVESNVQIEYFRNSQY